MTSISVLRTYRRLGLAAKLMRQSREPLLLLLSSSPISTEPGNSLPSLSLRLIPILFSHIHLHIQPRSPSPAEHAMNHLYKAHHITLHVRESNRPAISLYKDNLGFEQTGVEKGYCESCRGAWGSGGRGSGVV